MNKLKTFFYYLGTIILCNLGVALLVYSSNKIFDNLSDVFFVPTKAAALGYIPFILAAGIALKTTNNYEGTKKILWRWKLTIASLYSAFGIFQLIFGIYLGVPIFEFNEEITFSAIPNHWLYNVPWGILGIIAGIQVKRDNLDMI
tara:strand:+ start:8 stop:442 length:435 start_codon:yes stop_codon:yes gene_type:complete